MLNYIWAGLIIASFVFALGYDVRDIREDRYRNGRPLPVELAFPEGYEPGARRVPVVREGAHQNAGTRRSKPLGGDGAQPKRPVVPKCALARSIMCDLTRILAVNAELVNSHSSVSRPCHRPFGRPASRESGHHMHQSPA